MKTYQDLIQSLRSAATDARKHGDDADPAYFAGVFSDYLHKYDVDAANAIGDALGRERLEPSPAPASKERGALPADVVELVVAARIVAFEDGSRNALKRLDRATEAFADRVPWDEEPAPEPLDAKETAHT